MRILMLVDAGSEDGGRVGFSRVLLGPVAPFAWVMSALNGADMFESSRGWLSGERGALTS